MIFGKIDLTNSWSLYSISGSDHEKYFFNQLPTDIKKIPSNFGRLTAMLTSKGQIEAYFYILKYGSDYKVLIPKSIETKAIERINKFIITEDVLLEKIDKPIFLNFDAQNFNKELVTINYCGQPFAQLSHSNTESLVNLTADQHDQLLFDSSFILFDQFVETKTLLNETVIYDYAFDKNKGCYPGQEVVAIIESRNGAKEKTSIISFEQSIIKAPLFIEGQSAFKVLAIKELKAIGQLKRKFIDNNISFDFTQDEKVFKGTINLIKTPKHPTPEFLAQHFFEKSSSLHLKGHSKEAMSLLQIAHDLDKKNIDIIESLGVLNGQLKDFQSGIEWMDKLLEVDENSIMAHTNKSLFYMNLGKIDEAEEEKAIATKLQFEGMATPIESNKSDEMEESDIKKIKMFNQILDLDIDDKVANYSLGRIYNKYSKSDSAKTHLEKVIKVDQGYSAAYLELGISLARLEDKKYALEVFNKGSIVSKDKGDMLIHNKIKARISKLNN